MNAVRAAVAIAGKDLRTELRAGEALPAMLLFALLSGVLFSFAFDADAPLLRQIFPGLLWLAFVFAAALGLTRAFAAERAAGALHGLMAAPIDRSAIYFGKALGNLALIGVVELCALPAFLILFDVSLEDGFWRLLGVMAMGAVGLAGTGTLLAALTANLRAAEVLLPILLLPLLVPLVLGAVQLTAAATGALPWERAAIWLPVLLVYDAIALLLPWLLFDFLLEV